MREGSDQLATPASHTAEPAPAPAVGAATAPAVGAALASAPTAGPAPAPGAPALVRTPEGLELRGAGLAFRGDYGRMKARLRPENLKRELLVRAAKGKGPAQGRLVVDATAGMGEDSLLLAAAGFTVVMFEHDPTIAALLSDTLDRAKADPALAPVAARMNLHVADSVAALSSGTLAPDVVLLDPMFPARAKHALVNKKLQLFQMLEAPCPDDRALLAAALACGAHRIVVKRPAKGPYLAGVRPTYSLTGKAVRVDVIVR